MNIPVKVRQWLYVIAAVAAGALALAVVMGYVSAEDVTKWGQLVIAIYLMLVGILARVMTPSDSGKIEG